MLKIYDGVSSLTFPNGKTYTVSELKEHPVYNSMFFSTTVIEEENGITSSFVPLSVLKDSYKVVNANEEEALAECVAKIEEARQESLNEIKTVAQLSVQADETTEAVAELGAMTAESMASDADLLQVVGELGVQLAELSAKVDALQA